MKNRQLCENPTRGPNGAILVGTGADITIQICGSHANEFGTSVVEYCDLYRKKKADAGWRLTFLKFVIYGVFSIQPSTGLLPHI